MNLHAVGGPLVARVNPTKSGTVHVSTGFTTDAAGIRKPRYTVHRGVPLQVQALTGSELKQLDALNVQGVVRGAYLYGDISGLVRARQKGGDMVQFDGRHWLVVAVLETWPGWCKVALSEQTNAP